MTIVYPAVFEYADDGINISFPDIENCFTCAFSDEEAVRMAQEVLEIFLHGEKADDLPVPSDMYDIAADGIKKYIRKISVNMSVSDGILYSPDVTEFR